MSVFVDLKLAQALPGGLPAAVLVRDLSGRMTALAATHIAGIHADEKFFDGQLELPGPDGLNAAGLLSVLARSLGWTPHPAAPPHLTPDIDHAGVTWALESVENTYWIPRWLSDPGNDVTGMLTLRRLVHHVGRLYAVARAVGLEPAPGEWPRWSCSERQGTWGIGCGGLVRTWSLVEPGIGPYEALKRVHAEVCP